MRLINADALKEVICDNVYPVTDYFNSRDYGMFWTGGIEKAINEAPTIDAVQVVRCKGCRYYESKCDYPFCYYTENNVEPDGYCSFGEKTEVEE